MPICNRQKNNDARLCEPQAKQSSVLKAPGLLRLRLAKTEGAAILTALFIMTLVAIVTTAMIKRLHLEILRTERTIQTDKFYLAAQLAQFWSISTLSTWTKPLPMPDLQGQVFSLTGKLTHLYPGMVVTGGIYDLESKLNLNSLTDTDMQNCFIDFVQTTDPSLSKPFIQSISSAVVDWISPNVTMTATANQNKWAQYYASLPHAYLPAHQAMQSVFEFNRVAGVTPALFAKLYPDLITLPEVTKINLNTASARLLGVITKASGPEAVNAILTLREQGGIQTQQQFNEIVKKYKLNPKQVGFQSNYFLSVAIVTHKQQTFVLNTIIKRKQDKDKTKQPDSPEKWMVSVVRQSINTT